jgi:hypothetical protein
MTWCADGSDGTLENTRRGQAWYQYVPYICDGWIEEGVALVRYPHVPKGGQQDYCQHGCRDSKGVCLSDGHTHTHRERLAFILQID